MKYTQRYTVKWHDTDANRRLTPSHLLMYMEETSNRHLIDAGMSLDDLRDQKGLAFLLSRIAIRIYQPLYAEDEIRVETWVCESRGLSFVRCFRVLRGGEVTAEAYSVWALMDLHAKKLLPATAFPYQIEPELPLGPALSARVRFPSVSQMECAGHRRIVYSDIDYNGHMNNTKYPNMLCDFTPDIRSKEVVGITLSFLHEAAYDHELAVYRCPTDGGYCFRTVDGDGTVCLEAMLLTEPLSDVVS
jgi:YbgC/YbaW family acyl-CoA thioester hydrolase